MFSLVVHDRLQLYYKDDEIIIGDRAIPDNTSTKTLESLGATINLLIYGLNCFVEILTLDVMHVSMVFKLCSGKHLKLLK